MYSYFKSISPFSEDYPNIVEALEAKKQADIIAQQGMELFLSKPVKHVMLHLEQKNRGTSSDELFFDMGVFYYGYILGKRAERARHNHEKTGRSGREAVENGERSSRS